MKAGAVPLEGTAAAELLTSMDCMTIITLDAPAGACANYQKLLVVMAWLSLSNRIVTPARVDPLYVARETPVQSCPRSCRAVNLESGMESVAVGHVA